MNQKKNGATQSDTFNAIQATRNLVFVLDLSETLDHVLAQLIDVVLMLPSPVSSSIRVIHGLGPGVGNGLADGVRLVLGLEHSS